MSAIFMVCVTEKQEGGMTTEISLLRLVNATNFEMEVVRAMDQWISAKLHEAERAAKERKDGPA